MNEKPAAIVPRWCWIGLLAILLFDVWLRGHTFAPTIKQHLGFAPWPVVQGGTEPLDCDESAYAYIGRRLVRGDVMYRDLTENKPPLGYWLYASAVAIGGANELTVRMMPIPFVLLTIALIWWIGLRLGGPLAALGSAAIYAVVSTDPYLYGNGANLEHAINLFTVGSLAALVEASGRKGHRLEMIAGLCLGAATLIKQVAIIHFVVYAIYLIRVPREPVVQRATRLAVVGGGFSFAWAVAVGILLAQGAGSDAYEDIIRYGGALATDTPPDPNSPPFFVRWITGNSDPRNGRLPWPFGKTDWLVWWGTGSWPLWLAAVPALGWLALRRDPPSNAPFDLRARRLVAAWTLSAWIQVALPGLFWAHYYLLPVPGIALALGIAFSDAVAIRKQLGLVFAVVLGSAFLLTAGIQEHDYLRVPAEQLTVRYKGGAQWVTLRGVGHWLETQSANWPTRRLLVWGWQSPLFIYANMDGVSRHFFVDPLLKSQALAGKHPLIRPRLERVVKDVQEKRPDVVFAGDYPFPALRAVLDQNYRFYPFQYGNEAEMREVYRRGQGLWIRRDHASEFEPSPSSNPRKAR
jgi:4-amino-4-deoxy-L-arabinose transferase-like glycosyltransferase